MGLFPSYSDLIRLEVLSQSKYSNCESKANKRLIHFGIAISRSVLQAVTF